MNEQEREERAELRTQVRVLKDEAKGLRARARAIQTEEETRRKVWGVCAFLLGISLGGIAARLDLGGGEPNEVPSVSPSCGCDCN